MVRRSLAALLLLASSSVAAADPPALENGALLVGSPETGGRLEDPGALEPLLVTIDTPYEVFDDSGTLVHVAAWLPDGTPAGGARVYLMDHLLGRADASGTLVFRWGVPGAEIDDYWTNGSAINVRHRAGGHNYGGTVWFSALSRTESFESDHVYVYTDRAVYNPGQTIHVRSLAWNLAIDWSPLEGAVLEYLLTAPDGNTVAGVNVTTNPFGVATADLVLSEHLDEGIYRLQAAYEGAEAEVRLRVERFEPPVIRIEHTLGRFLTHDQEGLGFDVTLGYFTGGELANGTLAVDVLHRGASVWREERRVHGAGPHPVSIAPAPLDELRAAWGDGELIEIRITVTDAYDRSDDVTRDLTYTANPYLAVIEADRDAYSLGDPVELVVRLTDIERVPLREREVRLETTRGESLVRTTDTGGTVQFSLEMGEDSFEVSAYLADVEAPVAATWIGWQETQPMRSRIAQAIVSENQSTPIRITFPSHFEPVERVVHVDVVDSSGSLVNAVLVPVRRDGDAWIAEGELAAPSWGSMLLTLFCLGRDTEAGVEAFGEGETHLGLLTEGQNLIVHPNRELQIHLDGLPETVAPGADWEARVRITDADGSPVLAAVGAAVVDEAVIALKDPLEITPMDHFYNPELRVISTTGSAILTWPVVSRNWGMATHDIALPPFPFQAGGALEEATLAGHPELDESELAEAGGDGLAYSGVGSVGEGVGHGYGVGGGGSAQVQMMVAMPTVMAEPAEEGGVLAVMGGRVRGDAAQPPLEPVITVRTEFPETSLWAPLLETNADGSLTLTGRMPDALTNQELALVASDARGGVGVERHLVAVRQPLYVRADLPDALLLGDRVSVNVLVRNLSDAPDSVRVSLASSTLTVIGGPREVTVAAQGMSVVTFEVEASTAGEHEITASGRGASLDDRETRTLFVRPRGEPTETLVAATRIEDGWQATLEVPSGGQLTTVTLSVAFPAVTAAFAGLDALREELASGDTAATGGELIATALLWDYWRRTDSLPTAELLRWRQNLDGALAQLLAAQRPDGGWGFWWATETSPYLTGYALEALLTLQELDLPVPGTALERAVSCLVASVGEEGLWDQDAIAFWEGNDATVQRALAAELFGVLASVPESERPEAWAPLMQRLGERFEAYLEAPSPDLLTYANAVLGLHRLDVAGARATDPTRLAAAARRLADLGDATHWEPSWFNAYGGSIEATATALEVLAALDVELAAAEQRSLLRELLATRDGWGGWHNPRGTAAAIAAVLRLAPPASEAAGWVRVYVDEALVREVALDPADPFLSAVELRNLDLTGVVAPGERIVRVQYDGGLEPDVRLAVRRWDDIDRASAETVTLTAAVENAEVALGELTELVLEVRSTTGERSQVVRLAVTPPANTVIDRSSLAALREHGLVAATDEADNGVIHLYLELEPEARRELRLRLQGVRAGEAAIPAVTATVLGAPDDAEHVATALIERPFVVE